MNYAIYPYEIYNIYIKYIFVMNILQVHIEEFNQIIILVLGMPCSNKSEIAKELAQDLNLNIININDYIIKDKFVEKESENIKYKIYEDTETIDWNKLNKDVNKDKNVVIYGNFIDFDKIEFNPDYVLFYSLNNKLCKQLLIDNKLLDFDEKDETSLNNWYTNIFLPIYENIKSSGKINKFYNIKEDTEFEKIYDETFDILMHYLNAKLNKHFNKE